MILAVLLPFFLLGANAVLDCPAGQDDQADVGNSCANCTDGNFKDASGTQNCQPHTADPLAADGLACSAKSADGYAVVDGDNSTDNTCGCAAGYGSSDGSTCAACVAESTWSAGITAISVDCATVTVCAATQTIMTAGTVDSDVVCGCPDGEGTDDGIACAACTVGTNYSTGITALTGVDAACKAVSVACTTTDATQAELTAPTASADRTCGCADGEGTGDGITCAACTVGTDYSAGATPLTGLTAACAAVTVCAASQVELTAPTASADRTCGCPLGEGSSDGSTCVACTAGTNYSTAITPLTDDCTAVTVCGAGQAIATDGTTSADVVCGCDAGYGGVSPCTACATGTFQDTAGVAFGTACSTFTADPNAADGQACSTKTGYAVLAGNASTDNSCGCDAGFGGDPCVACSGTTNFSATITAVGVACDAVGSCPATQAVLTANASTTSEDQTCGCAIGEGTGDGVTCAACTEGTHYSTTVTALTGPDAACKAVTTCAATQVELTAATTSADRTCGCADGEGTADGTTCAACNAGTTYSAGITALTGADSACKAVTADPNAADGTACSTKQADGYATLAGTASTDNTCGCAAGHGGATCVACVPETHFSAAITAVGVECEAHSTCNGTGEFGVKTAGTATTDAVCFDAEQPASSAAAVAFSVMTFVAMLM